MTDFMFAGFTMAAIHAIQLEDFHEYAFININMCVVRALRHMPI